MGGDVTALPDINSDNVPDFAYVSKFTSDGEVIVRSGKTGDVISTLYKYLPRRIHSISDINNDGTAEIVIGSNDRKKDCPISVYSIVDSQLIMEYKAPQGEQDFDFGYNFVCNADVTNDDIPDLLAVGRLAFGLYASRVYVISGSDGSVISTIEINNDYSGVYLKYADVNGDGNTDVVIGSKFNIYVNEPDTGLLIHTLQTYTTKGENIWGTEYAIADLNDDGMDDFIAGVTLSDELVTQVNLVGGGRLLMYSQNFGRKYTIQPGNSYEFIIHGDLPGRNVRILASKIGSGCTNVPRYGLCIDLDRPIYSLGTAVTEEIDNNAYITLDVPGKFIQGNMWIQAVDPNHDTLGPITSNVIKLKVEE